MGRDNDAHVRAYRSCRVSTPEKQREAYYEMLERIETREANDAEPREVTMDKGSGPTPQREKIAAGDVDREALLTVDGETVVTIRMLDGSLLDMLLSRGQIDGDQYHAGGQFYADWYYSGLATSGVIDPMKDHVDNSPGAGESDRRLDAMTRHKNAIQALGMTLSQHVVCMLLNEEKPESYGRRRYGRKSPKLAKTSALDALKDALDALDIHYNGPRRNRQRAGHVAGYRPNIGPAIDN